MAIWSAPPTDSFEVRCDCGALVSGHREETCQTLICSACGQRVFALPASPYPQPEPPANHPDAQRLAAERRARRMAQMQRFARPAVRVGQWVRARCSPVRLAVVGVVALGTLTLWLTWRSIKTQQYVALLPNALAAGEKELDQGNFYQACEKLEEADRAAKWLGGNTPQAVAAQNLYLEARGWHDLAVESPRELCAQAQKYGLVPFQTTFASKYTGTTLIVDAWVRAELTEPKPPDNGPPVRIGLIDYVVYGPDFRGRLVIDQPPWLADLAIGEEQRFVFVAPLSAIEQDASGRWTLRLDGRRSVTLTVSGPLRMHGWNVDENFQVTLGPPSHPPGTQQPPHPVEVDSSAGVSPGDDELAVVRKLPPPDRVSRIAIRDRTDEQWVFRLTGLKLDLERAQSRTAARVVAVHAALDE